MPDTSDVPSYCLTGDERNRCMYLHAYEALG